MEILDLSADAYTWVKALHIISVIAWMAGLLYLPRIFVYHTECSVGSQQSETFKTMERRLFRVIMNPAMGATFIFGGLLLWNQDPYLWEEIWIYVKLLCVLGLIISHQLMGTWRRAFAENRNHRPASFYRVMNEVPTILMIVTVIFVVVKPF
jgi:protoporphyrinogen IX oxidase